MIWMMVSVLHVFVMVHTSAVLLAWCCVLLRDAASYVLRVARPARSYLGPACVNLPSPLRRQHNKRAREMRL